MKILICEFRQETNSFNPVVSDMAFWEKSGILEGGEIYKKLASKPCAVAGMIQAIEDTKSDIEIVYGISMSCQSGGPADQKVMDYFLNKLIAILKNTSPPDAVFISFHGALQTTKYDDAEGEIAAKIREVSGENTVIAASTDLHAYISPKMVKNIDVICGYHTYPHVDFFETGYRAAKLALDYLNGRVKPKMARVMIPMIVSAAAYNTMQGPFKELMDYAKSLVSSGKIIDFSVYQMQPWLDISQGGSTVLVISNDYETSEFYAGDIAQKLLDARKDFASEQYSIEEVIDFAEKNDSEKAVILVDCADSCNAGATGDNMAVAAKLLEKDSTLKTAIVVNDASAADLAHKTGVGKTGIFSIGATRYPDSVSVEVEGYVKSLHDGIFIQEGPAGRGLVNDIGPTAVIRIKNIDVVVCHWMAGNGDPQLYRAFGIEPTLYQLVVVKACTSFRAAYSKFTDLIFDTDTPGVAASNLTKLNFRKLPKTFYPWSTLDDYTINDVMRGRI